MGNTECCSKEVDLRQEAVRQDESKVYPETKLRSDFKVQYREDTFQSPVAKQKMQSVLPEDTNNETKTKDTWTTIALKSQPACIKRTGLVYSSEEQIGDRIQRDTAYKLQLISHAKVRFQIIADQKVERSLEQRLSHVLELLYQSYSTQNFDLDKADDWNQLKQMVLLELNRFKAVNTSGSDGLSASSAPKVGGIGNPSTRFGKTSNLSMEKLVDPNISSPSDSGQSSSDASLDERGNPTKVKFTNKGANKLPRLEPPKLKAKLL